jgi:Isocitrate lyase family
MAQDCYENGPAPPSGGGTIQFDGVAEGLKAADEAAGDVLLVAWTVAVSDAAPGPPRLGHAQLTNDARGLRDQAGQPTRSLAKMGYRFQFITLAGFHSLNHSMFELAYAYQRTGMAAYANFQQAEFASEARGYSATRHQREVGAGYFDDVAMAISGGAASTTALRGSTEEEQFTSPVPVAIG